MNIFHAHYEYLKESASILLKQCQGKETEAITRFHTLHSFATLTANNETEIASIKLKDAFSVVAVENGYESWTELKSVLDTAAETSPLAEIKDQFYPGTGMAYWNIWFAKYVQAKKVRKENNGFLLPYRNQFFVCEGHFVDRIGIPSSLPEWELIGRDWVHPKNVKAWLTLNAIFVAQLKD